MYLRSSGEKEGASLDIFADAPEGSAVEGSVAAVSTAAEPTAERPAAAESTAKGAGQGILPVESLSMRTSGLINA